MIDEVGVVLHIDGHQRKTIRQTAGGNPGVVDLPWTSTPARRRGYPTEFQIHAIDPGRLRAMRDRGADEYGNPWEQRFAQGWEPLRCCLREATAGEAIALICHTPWRSPSPWAEAGPVFVHFEQCAGYATPERYPDMTQDRKCILNPFDHSGARAYDHITFLGPQDDHVAAARAVLAHPDVAFLHVRSGAAGCLLFEMYPVEG